MANRTIQQKILKMKRRKRHAVFSGNTAKYAVRIDRGRFEGTTTTGDGDVVPSGKHVTIPVGNISLSRAVVNTGRGPDKERMQTYYDRLASFNKEIPPTLSERLDQEAFRSHDKERSINYLKDEFARLDLFFLGPRWYWVEVNYKKKFWRKSETYRTKAMADVVLENNMIRWVETISPEV